MSQEFSAVRFVPEAEPLMQQQLVTMLELQDRMNRRVHDQWREQNFAWHRALWLECGELIDHHGYKWWKQQVPDMPQVRLEVVDIWHFGMSMLFDGRAVDQIAADLLQEWRTVPVPATDVVTAAEALAQQTLASRRFPVAAFWTLLDATGLDFNSLYRQYIGKNVLNLFRQDQGYQEGTYVKQWAGREDNEHLLELLESIDIEAADFADRLYAALARRYREVRAASASAGAQ